MTVIFIKSNLPLWCVALALFVSGCASKSTKYSQQETIWTEEDLNNPVILEEEYEAKKKGELPQFDIPIVRNTKVETWIDYFQGRGAKWFRLYLERSGRYIPFMRKILKEHGLPEDLVYLAMIESGFNAKAYSRASAVGHWQFMKSTGRLYGLKADFWRDERRDPEKATIAAARHLKDLFDHFQDWKLAAAAYNAGQGRISRAIRRYKTEDFWELTRTRHLARETRNYVPKLIAAALMAKEPEKYGFTNIEYQEPLAYDKIILKKAVNLETLARKAKVALSRILYLNPELNHNVTPPNVKEYELRVPAGMTERFLEAYNNLGPEELFKFASYRIRRGDTISRIARNYGIPQREIIKLNKIRSVRRIRPGQVLLLPVPDGAKIKTARLRKEPSNYHARKKRIRSRRFPKAYPPAIPASQVSGTYKVRRGDSLWTISKRFGVSIYNLKKANGMRSNRILPGDTLNIPGRTNKAIKNTVAASPTFAEAKQGFTVHIVRRGDTLWDIAQRYGTSIRSIKRHNKLRRNKIKPGKRLLIPQT